MSNNPIDDSEIARLAQKMIDYLDSLEPAERAKLLKDNRQQLTTLQLVVAGALHDADDATQ